MDSADLFNGNNAACFAFQFAAQVKPDMALGLVTKLTDSIGQIASQLGCAQLQGIDDSQLMQFPGYKRSS